MEKIHIREYNVTPIKENRDELTIIIDENSVNYNNQIIKNTQIISEIIEIFNQNFDNIKCISDKKLENSKGGRQKSITILNNDKKYILIGNTSDKESIELYIALKNQVFTKLKNILNF